MTPILEVDIDELVRQNNDPLTKLLTGYETPFEIAIKELRRLEKLSWNVVEVIEE